MGKSDLPVPSKLVMAKKLLGSEDWFNTGIDGDGWAPPPKLHRHVSHRPAFCAGAGANCKQYDQYFQIVAIKMIRRGLDSPDMLLRFRVERQILAEQRGRKRQSTPQETPDSRAAGPGSAQLCLYPKRDPRCGRKCRE